MWAGSGGGGRGKGEGRGGGMSILLVSLPPSLTYAKVQCRQKWIELAECKG
jgi:hypothetical protein